MKNLKEQTRLKEIKKEFNYKDPFLLEEQLYEDEILIRNTAKDFATKELLPKIIEAIEMRYMIMIYLKNLVKLVYWVHK